MKFQVLKPILKSKINPNKIRSIPSHILKPNYITNPHSHHQLPVNQNNTWTDIQGITKASELAKNILYTAKCVLEFIYKPKQLNALNNADKDQNDLFTRHIESIGNISNIMQSGITTNQLDLILHNEIIRNGAYPSPLGYNGFPKSICTSINNVMCHGIPDDRILQSSDLVNVDVTVYLNGYHGDTSDTFVLSDNNQEAKRLVNATREALTKAIHVCRDGVAFSEIAKVVEEIASKYNCTVNPDFCGHGIGRLVFLIYLIQSSN